MCPRIIRLEKKRLASGMQCEIKGIFAAPPGSNAERRNIRQEAVTLRVSGVYSYCLQEVAACGGPIGPLSRIDEGDRSHNTFPGVEIPRAFAPRL